MYNFLVLGYIPGTDIQISFTMWCEAAIALFLVTCLHHSIRQHQFAGILPPTISSETMLPTRLERLTHRIAAVLPINTVAHQSVSQLQAFVTAQSTGLRGFLGRHPSDASE